MGSHRGIRVAAVALGSAAVFATGGGLAAITSGATTGTVVACATASTPAHTIVVDGAPVSTIPSASSASCATTTYTVPTVTQTVTLASPPGTTTAPVTTTSSGSTTFDSATAYLDAGRPSTTGATTVSTPAAFATAVANAKAGQTIDVLGNVVVPGEFTGFNRVISGGVVNVVFEPGAGFSGMAGSNLPAVWVENSGGWRLWGGTIMNPDGYGLLVYQLPGPFTWTGFTVSNTGNTCVAVLPVSGNITGLTLKGVAGTATPDLALDPHSEKGTGIHAWNLADATGGLLQSSTIAADVADEATGAGVEVDMGRIGSNVTLFARARHLGFAVAGTTWIGVAATQVAGNVVQLWGGAPKGALDIRYAEGNGIEGRILEASGASSGASYAQSSLDYGVATGPILQNTALSRVAYDVASTGMRLGSVSPLP